MKKISIFASLLVFTLVSCKSSSGTSSSTNNSNDNAKVTETSPVKPSSTKTLRSKTYSKE